MIRKGGDGTREKITEGRGRRRREGGRRSKPTEERKGGGKWGGEKERKREHDGMDFGNQLGIWLSRIASSGRYKSQLFARGCICGKGEAERRSRWPFPVVVLPARRLGSSGVGGGGGSSFLPYDLIASSSSRILPDDLTFCFYFFFF